MKKVGCDSNSVRAGQQLASCHVPFGSPFGPRHSGSQRLLGRDLWLHEVCVRQEV